jgi:hypothetical protein
VYAPVPVNTVRASFTGSIQNPDLLDLEISPGSFGVNSGVERSSSCGSYSPSQATIRDVAVLRTILTPEGMPGGKWPKAPESKLTATSPAPLDADYVLPTARLAKMRQQWWYVGATLGDIVYSLPLAPGETVQLATIEWSRQDRISRADTVKSLDQLSHTLTHDRTLSETIEAALKENQNGFSLMGGTSTSSNAGASLDLSAETGFPLNIAAGASGLIGAAGSVAVTNGERNLSAESTQALTESINQSAWSMRSLNSTVVVQADQVEGSTVQT